MGKVINAQLDVGCESSSGFRDVFSRIMGESPKRVQPGQILRASWMDAPLGPMVGIAHEEALYLLEVVDRRGLEREIERLRNGTRFSLIPGKTPPPLVTIEKELQAYFEGDLKVFKTPVHFRGSSFQNQVWACLQQIPYGQTRSYKEVAIAIQNPLAVRACASANGAHQLALIVPCHRVINACGELGGYGGGLVRKQWPLSHEGRH